MKNIFYCYLLSLLLLFSPSKATHLSDEDTIKRGLAIYQSLSRTWIDTREEITKDGLVPFIDRLADVFKKVAFIKDGTTESFITAKVKGTAPDIQKTLSDFRNYNLQHYNQPNIFSSLNILEANAFFYTLGSRYQNVDDFIAGLLCIHLPKTQNYKLFCEWCGGISPVVRAFFCTYIANPYPQPANMTRCTQTYQLLWYEPYQLLPQAINTRLEELYAVAYSPAELQPISSISGRKESTTMPQ